MLDHATAPVLIGILFACSVGYTQMQYAALEQQYSALERRTSAVEQLVAQVPIRNSISFVTFNPRDAARIAVTGADELCEFWHYSSRNAHIAPISHLPDIDGAAYTHHVWLENTVVLAGTDDGRVVLIQV